MPQWNLKKELSAHCARGKLLWAHAAQRLLRAALPGRDCASLHREVNSSVEKEGRRQVRVLQTVLLLPNSHQRRGSGPEVKRGVSVFSTQPGNPAAAQGSPGAGPSAPRTGPLCFLLPPQLSGLGFFGKHRALRQSQRQRLASSPFPAPPTPHGPTVSGLVSAISLLCLPRAHGAGTGHLGSGRGVSLAWEGGTPVGVLVRKGV